MLLIALLVGCSLPAYYPVEPGPNPDSDQDRICSEAAGVDVTVVVTNLRPDTVWIYRTDSTCRDRFQLELAPGAGVNLQTTAPVALTARDPETLQIVDRVGFELDEIVDDRLEWEVL